jgi:predicted  nucleic acid-binding Zn-ribbon protein
MVRLASTFVLLLAGHGEATESRVNPIRKVVTMLQMMQNKVTAEGKKAEEIYDKFMCYCDNADTMLAGAITTAENKIPQLEAAVGKDVELKKQLETDVKNHKADREAAKGAIAEATALREKEAAEFAKISGDLKTNIAALAKAIPAIEKGMGSGFLQTSSATVVRQLSIDMDMSNVDRQMLASFLGSKNGYAPASGEIVGILKTMNDEMVQNLADTTAAEESAIAAFEELKAAKTKEIDALSKSIEEKMTRIGEIAVKVAEMGNELEDTKEDLEESKKFLAQLDENCANKKKEWAAYQKMQGEELLALADTIKILNDDDALELFKKTLPGSAASSFLQIQVSAQTVMRSAMTALSNSRRGADPRVDLIEVALRGGKVGFEKIIKLIDELTAKLKEEQAEDDKKKEWCEAEFDKTEDTKKVLLQDKSDLETSISDAEESIANLKAEIEALDDGIRALDKEVADATATRKEENEEFEATYAANTAAVDILKFAKNRLNKFYNPKLYKPPAKRELSEDEQITLNMGGTLAPTAAPGGIAGTGIGLDQQGAAPPPPPEANLAYKTKGEESSGVIQMIDTIVNDVEKENQVMKLEEEDAQDDYEKFMADAKDKRAADSKSMSDAEGTLAETDEQMVTDKGALKNKETELMETDKYLSTLHADCDFLIKYYDMRKEARTGEIDAMGKAKDVLNGADYSF